MNEQTTTTANDSCLTEAKTKLDGVQQKVQKDNQVLASLNAKLEAKQIVAQEAVDASTAADAHAAECVREALKHQVELTDIAVQCQEVHKSLIESNQVMHHLQALVDTATK